MNASFAPERKSTMSDDYRYPHSRMSLPVISTSPGIGASAAPPAAASPAAAAPPAKPEKPAPGFLEEKLLHGKVIEALREVYDPEIPVNIFDLGLIYDIKINPDQSVRVVMTLTAPACPVAGSLPGEVEKKIEAIPEVKSADVELVWEPAWSRDLMSEAALLTLGML
jgi:FeS assembly SUF system protein